MRGAITEIVAGMRADGVVVGPGEAIDAARAAGLLGVEDRAALLAGLAATLAKTAVARESFSRHFGRVFAPPRPPVGDRKGRRGEGGAGDGVSGTGGGPQTGAGAGRGSTANGSTAEDRAAGPVPAKGRTAGAVPAKGRAGGGAPETARTGGAASNRRSPGRSAKPRPSGRGDPRRLALAAPLTVSEEAAIVAELPRLLAGLRVTESRRRHPGRRGPLDVQRALRRNFSHGGVPFLLPRRQRRKAPPHLAFLLDVSWSAARGAGLLLLMAAAVLRRFRTTRVFVFVDRPVEVTSPFRAWLRGELAPTVLDRLPAAPTFARHRRPGEGRRAPDARARGDRPGGGLRPAGGGPDFASLLAGLADLNLGAPSDYGRALTAFADEVATWPRETLLVVYGDGRTNRFPPCPWAAEALAARFRRTAWLVPEPPARWGTGDSALPAYAEFMDAVYAVETTEALALALEDVVRGLR